MSVPAEGEALLHHGGAGLADELGPVLRAALDRGDDVVLTCAPERKAVLTAAVGDHPRLALLPRQEAWRRPAAAMAFYAEVAERAAAAGRGLLVVADSEFGGPRRVDWSEWARFEAAVHRARTRHPVRSFCLLDCADAPPEVVAATRRLHPVVRADGTAAPSPAYVDAAESVRLDGYVDRDPQELGPPALELTGLTGPDDLPAARHALAAEIDRHGLPPWRAHELLLAAGEVAANAVRHGRPPVRVRLWASPDRLLCAVTDGGAGFDFPLSCYLGPPRVGSGLGLFLARQVADQMSLHWIPDGFTVRVAVLRGPVSGP